MLHSNLREIGMKYKFKTGQLWMLLIFVCSYLLYTNEMERRSKANDALLSSERSESMAITMTESTENYAVYSKYPLSSPYIRGVVLLFHGCGKDIYKYMLFCNVVLRSFKRKLDESPVWI